MTTPTLTQSPCQCGDRAATECPGPWEPGCDLGANEAHVRVAPTAAGDALAAALAAPVEKAAPSTPSDARALAQMLMAGADDPMWANHAEVNKATLRRAAEALRFMVGQVETLTALSAQQAAQPVAGGPVKWTPGPNVWKDWCSQWFGPDADDAYLARAVYALPPMAQRFAYTAAPAPVALTDEQWLKLRTAKTGQRLRRTHDERARAEFLEWMRFAEAAYGIKDGAHG